MIRWSRFLLVRLLAKHNPFYLMSAACMLAGILALTNSLSWRPIPISRLLILIATLNIYEAALIGLALFLISRRKLLRDGKILLILEAFFLADTSFLNAEIVTASYSLGVAINVLLYLLAVAKLTVVLKVLKPEFGLARYAFLFFELAALFAVPCILRRIDHGALSPLNFYAAWWLLGLLPAIYEFFAWSLSDKNPVVQVPTLAATAAPIRLYLVLPWMSLMLHVSILHYVYDVTFYGAMATPVLLGLAIVIKRAMPSKLIPRGDLRTLQVLLPLAAVLVSLNDPRVLQFGINHSTLLQFSPLGLAVAGAFVTYVYCFFAAHALAVIGSAAILFLIFKLGPTPARVWDIIASACSRLLDWTDRFTPKSTSQWGVVSLVFSFIFLIVGAIFSLHRHALLQPNESTRDLKDES